MQINLNIRHLSIKDITLIKNEKEVKIRNLDKIYHFYLDDILEIILKCKQNDKNNILKIVIIDNYRIERYFYFKYEFSDNSFTFVGYDNPKSS